MKKNIQFLIILSGSLILFGFTFVSAAAIGDYQSYKSGNWQTKSTWSRWDGTAWINPAPHTPSSADGIITILNGHSIDVPANDSADQLVVNAGATISIQNTFTIDNGPDVNDMVINGTIVVSGSVAGTITGSGSFMLSPGGTLSTSKLAGVKGCFTSSGGKIFSAGVNYIFNAKAVQSTGFSGLSVGNPNNITIDDSSGVTLDASITTGTITFTNGRLITGVNTVTLEDGGTIVGAGIGKYVYGNLGRVLGSSGSPTLSFDVGDAINYTPVSVEINSLSSGGILTASTTSGQHSSIGGSKINNARDVSRYWTLTNSGTTFTSYSATFHFVAEDIVGSADPNNFIAGKYHVGSWSYPAVGTKTATSTQITGETSFSDFAIGEIKMYTITASAGANGSISPLGVTYVPMGDSVVYTITPNTNYNIDSVLVDGIYFGRVPSYTFTNVTADHTINATSFIKTYVLSVTAVDGSVTKNPNYALYDSVSFVQLTAVPDPLYTFKGWTGDVTGTTNPVYVLMDTDKNVTAHFTIDIEMSMISGWNLVSVPVEQTNDSAAVIFYGKFGDMFRFDAITDNYGKAPILEIGQGYWVYYPITTTVTITGPAVTGSIQVLCQAGWNLVGSCEIAIDKTALTTNPADQIFGDIFRYDPVSRSYQKTAVINPGVAVWMYVTAACMLTIP